MRMRLGLGLDGWQARGTGGDAPMNLVYVNGDGTGGVTASPYTVKAGDLVVVGTDHGNVTLNWPTLSPGQQAEIKQDAATSYVTNTISVVAPMGVAMQKVDGTFTTAGGTYVLPSGAVDAGIDIIWFNGGTPSGNYLIR